MTRGRRPVEAGGRRYARSAEARARREERYHAGHLARCPQCLRGQPCATEERIRGRLEDARGEERMRDERASAALEGS